jgi:methionine salvage enolase-phosphatase E1
MANKRGRIMIVRAVWVDLAALFDSQPDDELVLFPDALDAFEQWRALGLKVVGITADARRCGSRLSSFFDEAFVVIDRPLPQWRQMETWLDLAQEMAISPEQVVFITSAPMLMSFAHRAGLRTVGVLRDPHTMAVLDGYWVDSLTDIDWRDPRFFE